MKTIYGFGINNATYKVNWTENGKSVRCKIFSKWKAMLSRCYSSTPTILLPSVCEEWRYFMNFYGWVHDKNFNEYALDKDILQIGNTLYSPETCILLPPRTNSLLTDSRSARGEFPIGVRYKKKPLNMVNELSKPYEAYCGFNGKQLFIGTFPDLVSAHCAWQRAKILAIESEIEWLQSIKFEDDRVYPALDGRIEILKSDITNKAVTTIL